MVQNIKRKYKCTQINSLYKKKENSHMLCASNLNFILQWPQNLQHCQEFYQTHIMHQTLQRDQKIEDHKRLKMNLGKKFHYKSHCVFKKFPTPSDPITPTKWFIFSKWLAIGHGEGSSCIITPCTGWVLFGHTIVQQYDSCNATYQPKPR